MKSLTENGIIYNNKDDRYHYVYRNSVQPVTVFDGLAMDMEQLNSFCYIITKGVDDKIQHAMEKVRHANTNLTEYEEELEYYSDEAWYWEDTQKFLLPATCVVVIYFFVEKSLKDLNRYFNIKVKNTVTKPKQLKGQSKIQAAISFMKDEYFPDLVIKNNFWNLLKKANKVRNSYAHGDWDKVEELIKDIDLVDTFKVVTELLESIENEYISWEKSSSRIKSIK